MVNNIQSPPPLNRGSTIGIIAPSGNIQNLEAFDAGVRILHEMGFKTAFPRDLWPGYQYLADADEKRVEEFHVMYNDPEIHAIMAARGGFGCLRILDQLDSMNISSSQKLVIGFSDITLLHYTLQSSCSLMTLHGPVVTSLPLLTKDCLEQFYASVTTDLKRWSFSDKVEILRGGENKRGITAGGNLATIISSIGTKHQQQWKDKIVFLEDTAEPSYRIDRMLTQLKLAGMLDDAAAFILGDFSNGLEIDNTSSIRQNESVWNRMLELTQDKTSLWADFPIGHGHINYSIPMGLMVTLDNSSGSLYT